MKTGGQHLYGLLAEFATPEALVRAAQRAYADGYRAMDAYSPFPVHGLDDALGVRRTRLPRLILGGGLTGAICGFGMQYISCVLHYPLNVGGRPLNSWPSFIPVTFEMTILFSVFAAVFGMLALNNLPLPHHPLFAVPEFKRASQDRFFLCIEGRDARFDATKTHGFLTALGAMKIVEVPR
jgi:hypothetical protein